MTQPASSRLNRQTGFTMIELLVVATVMIILTTIGIVSYRNASLKARDGKRRADLETIRSALVLYKTDSSTGLYPDEPYADMISTLVSADYLDSSGINDPNYESKGSTYSYAVTSGGRGFELCATLESEVDPKCVYNP